MFYCSAVNRLSCLSSELSRDLSRSLLFFLATVLKPHRSYDWQTDTYTQVSKLGNPADGHGREGSLRKRAMLQRDSASCGLFGAKIKLFTLSGFVPRQMPLNRIRMARRRPCKQELISFPSRWFEALESSDRPLSARSEREDQQTVLLPANRRRTLPFPERSFATVCIVLQEKRV